MPEALEHVNGLSHVSMLQQLDGESAESCLFVVYLHQRPSALAMLRTQISQNMYAESTAAALQLCAEEGAAKGAVAGGGTKTIPELEVESQHCDNFGLTSQKHTKMGILTF